MGTGIKRVVSLTAIYVIALQTILLGIAPVVGIGSSAVDLFFVICQSDGQALASNAPTEEDKDHQPGQGCGHCTLCDTSAPLLVSFIVIGIAAFLSLTLVLRPAPKVLCVGLKFDPKLARGPPQIVLT